MHKLLVEIVDLIVRDWKKYRPTVLTLLSKNPLVSTVLYSPTDNDGTRLFFKRDHDVGYTVHIDEGINNDNSPRYIDIGRGLDTKEHNGRECYTFERFYLVKVKDSVNRDIIRVSGEFFTSKAKE